MQNKPSIILVDPQLGENIGMVARAMLNCGLTDLRIVNPRDGWPSDTAIRAASGALEQGVTATVFNTTQEAIADLHWSLATTARPRDMIKEVYTAEGAMAKAHTNIATGQKIGVLFGAERTGLENDDIALASAIVTIPLNPAFSSLNLAQAVLIIAYEFMRQADKTPSSDLVIGKTDMAAYDTITNFTDRLIDSIDKSGFFKSPDMRPTITRNIQNLFTRHPWTDQDIQTLHGILSSLTKDR